MSTKIKIILSVLVFWVALFIAWEWWHSFPKVRTGATLNVSSKSAGIDSILNQAMSTYLLPGISAVVVRNDQVIYLNAIGFKNLGTKDSLTIESQILVASVSKLFTALALANVLNENGVAASDPLAILDLKSLGTTNLSNLYFRDLLNHTSGLKDKNFREKILSTSKTQTLYDWGIDFIQTPVGPDLAYKDYSYADSNYDLLGFLLGEIEQLDFSEIVQEKVFGPSQMSNSEFVTNWPIEENGIIGYQKTFLWKRIEPKRIKFPVLPSPSSGLVTTTKDMSLALTHLLRGERGAFQKQLEWLNLQGDNQQLGFQKIQINDKDWIGHFGGQAGYSSLLFYSKEAKTGIFLFSNSRDKEDFRIAIARQVLDYIAQ